MTLTNSLQVYIIIQTYVFGLASGADPILVPRSLRLFSENLRLALWNPFSCSAAVHSDK